MRFGVGSEETGAVSGGRGERECGKEGTSEESVEGSEDKEGRGRGREGPSG